MVYVGVAVNADIEQLNVGIGLIKKLFPKIDFKVVFDASTGTSRTKSRSSTSMSTIGSMRTSR